MSAKETLRLAGAIIVVAFLAVEGQPAQADTYYWTTAGSGNPLAAGSGNWDSVSNVWATDTTGASGGTWPGGNDADFYASGTSTITVNGTQSVGNITFDGSGYSLSGGNLALGGGTITTNQDATISSVIGGSVGLTKAGNGTLTLGTQLNTFNGGTTVNAGTLVLGTGGGTGVIQGALTINSGGTLSADRNWSLGYGAATCVSAITINGGELNFGGTLVGGGMSPSSITMTGGTIGGSQPGWYNGITSTPTLTTSAASTTAVISSGFQLRLSNTGSLTFNVAQGSAPGGVDLLVSGAIATDGNTEGVTKSGPGLLSLTAINNYTGGTTVNGGTLLLAPGGSTGIIRGNLTINSGATVSADANQWSLGYLNSSGNSCVSAIAINGGVLTFTDPGNAGNNGGMSPSSITMTGGTISGYFALYNGITSTPTLTTSAAGSTAVISDGLNLRLSNTGSLTFNVAPGNTANGIDLLVSGPINNGTGGTIVKTGSGVLCLTGTINYGGATTTINGGTLQLGNGGATGSINTGNNIVDNANLTFNRSNAVLQGTDFTSSAISGSGSLTQAGSGTLTLSAQNTYSGGTTVNGGTLALTQNSATGTIRGNLTINSGATVNSVNYWSLGYGDGGNPCVSAITINGGLLNFSSASGGGFAASSIAMTGGTISGVPPTDVYKNSVTIIAPTLTTNPATTTAVISGGLNLRLNGNNLTFNVSQGTTASGVDLLLSGPIEYDNSNDGVVKTGSGLLNLAGASTYTGGTLLQAGTLQLGINNALPSAGTLTFGTVGGNGTLDLAGYNQQLRGLAVDPSAMAAGQVIGNSSTGSTSTLTYSSPNPSTFAGTIQDTLGSGNQQVALAVSSGLLNLGAANTYSGNTTLSGGTLQLGNALALQNSTVVANNGSLDLNGPSGTVSGLSGSGVLTLTNGTLNVGNNAANTTFSGQLSGAVPLVKIGAGTLTMNAYGTYHDQTDYNGSTTVNGGTLALGPGGGNGVIAGTLTINSGATVNAAVAWSLGYGATTCVSGITVNGGVLTFTGTTPGGNAGGGTSASSITMTGGTIGGSLPAWYSGITATPELTTNPSTTTAVISSGLDLRLGSGGNAWFNVSQGTTASGVDLLISGPITLGTPGSGILKTGAGLLCLSGTSGYSGATTVSGGTLSLTGAIAGSNVTVNDPSAVFNEASSGAIGGAGMTFTLTSGLATLLAQNTYAGGTFVNGGTLGLGPTHSGTGIIRGNLTIGSGATVNAAADWSLGYASGSCVSGITINGGVLNFTGTTNTGGGTSVSGITMTGGTISGVQVPDWYSGITHTPMLTTNASADTAVISSGLNFRLGSNGNVTFNVDQGSTASGVDLLISGPISAYSSFGGGGGGITKTGPGVMSLTAQNSYTGGTALQQGTIILGGGNNTLPTGTTLTLGYLDTSGTLDLAGNNQRLAGLAVSPLASPGSQVIGNSSTSSNSLLTYSGASSTFGGTIQDTLGSGSMTTALQVSGGTLILSGNNSYTGGTDVAAELEITSSGGIPYGTGLTVETGGTVVLDPSAAGATMFARSLPVASPAAGRVAAVPEPGTLALLGVAGIFVAAAAWRRRKGI